MKPGDLITWDAAGCGMKGGAPGKERGLIVGDDQPPSPAVSPTCLHEELYDPSPFTVLWSDGTCMRPASAYLRNFRVVE